MTSYKTNAFGRNRQDRQVWFEKTKDGEGGTASSNNYRGGFLPISSIVLRFPN
jgi:hypothetical protein